MTEGITKISLALLALICVLAASLALLPNGADASETQAQRIKAAR